MTLRKWLENYKKGKKPKQMEIDDFLG